MVVICYWKKNQVFFNITFEFIEFIKNDLLIFEHEVMKETKYQLKDSNIILVIFKSFERLSFCEL